MLPSDSEPGSDPGIPAFYLSRAGLVEAGTVTLTRARDMVRRGQALWVAGRVGGRPTVLGRAEPTDPGAAGCGLLVRVNFSDFGAEPASWCRQGDGPVPPLVG